MLVPQVLSSLSGAYLLLLPSQTDKTAISIQQNPTIHNPYFHSTNYLGITFRYISLKHKKGTNREKNTVSARNYCSNGIRNRNEENIFPLHGNKVVLVPVLGFIHFLKEI